MVSFQFSKDFTIWVNTINNIDPRTKFIDGSYEVRQGYNLTETPRASTFSIEAVGDYAFIEAVKSYKYIKVFKDDVLTFVGRLNDELNTIIESLDTKTVELKYIHLFSEIEDVKFSDKREDVFHAIGQDGYVILDNNNTNKSLVHILVNKLITKTSIPFKFINNEQNLTPVLEFSIRGESNVLNVLSELLLEYGYKLIVENLDIKILNILKPKTEGIELTDCAVNATVINKEVSTAIPHIEYVQLQIDKNATVYREMLFWGWDFRFSREDNLPLKFVEDSNRKMIYCEILSYDGPQDDPLVKDRYLTEDMRNYHRKLTRTFMDILGGHEVIKANVTYAEYLTRVSNNNSSDEVAKPAYIYSRENAEIYAKTLYLIKSFEREQITFVSKVKLNVDDVVKIKDIYKSCRIFEVTDTLEPDGSYTYRAFTFDDKDITFTQVENEVAKPAYFSYLDIVQDENIVIKDNKYSKDKYKIFLDTDSKYYVPHSTIDGIDAKVNLDSTSQKYYIEYVGTDITKTEIVVEAYIEDFKVSKIIDILSISAADSKSISASFSQKVFVVGTDGNIKSGKTEVSVTEQNTVATSIITANDKESKFCDLKYIYPFNVARDSVTFNNLLTPLADFKKTIRLSYITLNSEKDEYIREQRSVGFCISSISFQNKEGFKPREKICIKFDVDKTDTPLFVIINVGSSVEKRVNIESSSKKQIFCIVVDTLYGGELKVLIRWGYRLLFSPAGSAIIKNFSAFRIDNKTENNTDFNEILSNAGYTTDIEKEEFYKTLPYFETLNFGAKQIISNLIKNPGFDNNGEGWDFPQLICYGKQDDGSALFETKTYAAGLKQKITGAGFEKGDLIFANLLIKKGDIASREDKVMAPAGDGWEYRENRNYDEKFYLPNTYNKYIKSYGAGQKNYLEGYWPTTEYDFYALSDSSGDNSLQSGSLVNILNPLSFDATQNYLVAFCNTLNLKTSGEIAAWINDYVNFIATQEKLSDAIDISTVTVTATDGTLTAKDTLSITKDGAAGKPGESAKIFSLEADKTTYIINNRALQGESQTVVFSVLKKNIDGIVNWELPYTQAATGDTCTITIPHDEKRESLTVKAFIPNTEYSAVITLVSVKQENAPKYLGPFKVEPVESVFKFIKGDSYLNISTVSVDGAEIATQDTLYPFIFDGLKWVKITEEVKDSIADIGTIFGNIGKDVGEFLKLHRGITPPSIYVYYEYIIANYISAEQISAMKIKLREGGTIESNRFYFDEQIHDDNDYSDEKKRVQNGYRFDDNGNAYTVNMRTKDMYAENATVTGRLYSEALDTVDSSPALGSANNLKQVFLPEVSRSFLSTNKIGTSNYNSIASNKTKDEFIVVGDAGKIAICKNKAFTENTQSTDNWNSVTSFNDDYILVGNAGQTGIYRSATNTYDITKNGGSDWAQIATNASYGINTTKAIAVGKNGQVGVFDGSSWNISQVGTDDFTSIAYLRNELFLAVGGAGQIALFDGTKWDSMKKGQLKWNCVSSNLDSTFVFVGQNGSVGKCLINADGSKTITVEQIAVNDFYTVSALEYDVYIVAAGQNGQTAIFDGTRWNTKILQTAGASFKTSVFFKTGSNIKRAMIACERGNLAIYDDSVKTFSVTYESTQFNNLHFFNKKVVGAGNDGVIAYSGFCLDNAIKYFSTLTKQELYETDKVTKLALNYEPLRARHEATGNIRINNKAFNIIKVLATTEKIEIDYVDNKIVKRVAIYDSATFKNTVSETQYEITGITILETVAKVEANEIVPNVENKSKIGDDGAEYDEIWAKSIYAKEKFRGEKAEIRNLQVDAFLGNGLSKAFGHHTSSMGSNYEILFAGQQSYGDIQLATTIDVWDYDFLYIVTTQSITQTETFEITVLPNFFIFDRYESNESFNIATSKFSYIVKIKNGRYLTAVGTQDCIIRKIVGIRL